MGVIEFKWLDLLDIAIVAVIIYYFLSFIRGTRALQILAGFAMLIIISLIGGLVGLATLSWLGKTLGLAGVIIFVIVFQTEIRNALARLGRARFVSILLREARSVIDELVESAYSLSERGVGGLIVIERRVGLKEFIDTGRPLNAGLSRELIGAIFTPYSPLHDGAVIIRGDTIVAAGCILPLSDSPKLDHTMGTRHRAALGLAEQTDAVVIVVSEETSRVSLAVNGELKIMSSKSELREKLKELL